MPLTKLAVDALGVVTICLVILLVLIGLFCIIHTLYFCYRIQQSGFTQLRYFNGPWIVRISFVLFGIWWAVNEIARLGLLRQKGSIVDLLAKEWQEDICKYYILANLGFAEPCLFIIMCFLLRASLKWRGSGILSPRWNARTAGYVLLYCFPVFLLDLIFVFVVPKIGNGNSKFLKLPPSFTRTMRPVHTDGHHAVSVCCFPLLCTILHGIFTFILIVYLLFLGRRMVSSVINKSLQRRIYTLIFLVSCFLPSRVILLGFSVLARAHFLLLEALAFAGFVSLLSCVIVAIFMLVYLPVADSLALRSSLLDAEAGSRYSYTSAASAAERYSYEPIPLVPAASQSLETSTGTSVGRDSDASTKPGSISFRTMIKDEPSATSAFEEELRVFSPGFN